MPALSISWIIPACPSSTCLCDLKPPHNLCTRFHENMIMIKSEFRHNSIIKCEVNHSWATGSCLSPINLVHVWRVLQPSISLPIFDIVFLPLTVKPSECSVFVICYRTHKLQLNLKFSLKKKNFIWNHRANFWLTPSYVVRTHLSPQSHNYWWPYFFHFHFHIHFLNCPCHCKIISGHQKTTIW